MKSRSRIVFGAALALTLALPVLGRADGKDGKDNDRAAKEWTVNFGQPQPQTPVPPGPNNNVPPTAGAAVTHFLAPNDLTIVKGDSVNFIVNGDAVDLCNGTTNDNNEANNPSEATQIANRKARFDVCNGNVATGQTISGVAVVGTQNLEYMITDGKNNLIIDTGANVVIPATTGPPPTPAIIVVDNPRVDDTTHTHRLLGTSGSSTAGDTTGLAAIRNNRAGAFLTGSAAPAT